MLRLRALICVLAAAAATLIGTRPPVSTDPAAPAGGGFAVQPDATIARPDHLPGAPAFLPGTSAIPVAAADYARESARVSARAARVDPADRVLAGLAARVHAAHTRRLEFVHKVDGARLGYSRFRSTQPPPST